MPDSYFITGAGRGLGLALAQEASKRGGILYATVRDPARAPEIAEIAHSLLRLDVADPQSIEALPQQAGVGPIDILINNAGVSSAGKSITALDAADLQRIMMINAIAPVLVTKSLLANLRAGRRRIVVNITSQLGSISGNRGGSSYGYRASKSALNMFTVSLGHELAGEGFTCVVVHPGWVRTEMGGPEAPLSPEQSARSLLDLVERLTPADNGSFLSHDGRPIPW